MQIPMITNYVKNKISNNTRNNENQNLKYTCCVGEGDYMMMFRLEENV